MYDYDPTWIQREVPGLQAELDSWVGTRYRRGTCLKGTGVDCGRFVCAVLCSLLGCDEADVAGAHEGIGVHNAPAAQAEVERLLTHYPSAELVSDNTLAPGDVILVGPIAAGVTSAMICSDKRQVFYRAAPRAGVCISGPDLPHCEVKSTYRLWAV